jgi:thymidine kinase
MKLRSTPVLAAANRILAQGCDVVGIDEAQFLTMKSNGVVDIIILQYPD